MSNLEITVHGKKYKVLKLTAQVMIDEINKANNADLRELMIDKIYDKLIDGIMDELEKSDATQYRVKHNEEGQSIHTMTVFVLEEKHTNTLNVNNNVSLSYITDKSIRPVAYNKST